MTAQQTISIQHLGDTATRRDLVAFHAALEALLFDNERVRDWTINFHGAEQESFTVRVDGLTQSELETVTDALHNGGAW